MLLVSRFQLDLKTNLSGDRNRTIFALRVCQLFVHPDLYENLEGTRIGPVKEPTPYPGSLDNLSIENVTRHYALHGMTLAQADDAYTYAHHWLSDNIERWPSQADEIKQSLEAAA